MTEEAWGNLGIATYVKQDGEPIVAVGELEFDPGRARATGQAMIAAANHVEQQAQTQNG